MGITLTPVVFVLRAGPKHNKYGDSYDFAATVTVAGEVSHIQGAAGKLTLKVAREVRAALKKHGIKKGVWDRMKNRKFSEREYK